MKNKGFEHLYIESLRDLYSAETQLTEALPKVEAAAKTKELQLAVKKHLKETEGQIKRLDKIFQSLKESPQGKECAAMKGLVKEAAELIKEEEAGAVRDAGLIGAAQKVEHYEIAGYGTARTFARLLGHEDHAELLQETLDEESMTDEALTELAETMINDMALNEGGGSAKAPREAATSAASGSSRGSTASSSNAKK